MHIVYDGAPFSGKTASIQSLSRLLERPVVSPEVHNGRTLLFDWMEYQGGVRYGRPIVCRVITVPGQADLAHRRIRLLRSADGIIFVVDSAREAFGRTLEQWSNLQVLLARWKLETTVTLQINKRDAGDAVPVQEVLDRFGKERVVQHFKTEAIHDRGTREAFVLTAGQVLRDLEKRGGLRRHLTETQPVQAIDAEQLAEILRDEPSAEAANQRALPVTEE
ncbi:MAG: GTPase domain-containing protein [Acidobacteriota bacterium]